MGEIMTSQCGRKRIHVDGRRVLRHFDGYTMTPRARWYHANSMFRYIRRSLESELFDNAVMITGQIGRFDGIRIIES